MIKIFVRNLLIAWVLVFIAYMALHFLGFNSTHHERGDLLRSVLVIFPWSLIFINTVMLRALSGKEHNFLVALRFGFLFAIIFSLGYTLFIAFYQHAVNPDFYSTYRTYFEERLAATKPSTEVMETKMREFDISYNGAFPSYLLFFISSAMRCSLAALLAAALYRNVPKDASVQ
ncbi:MAG: hypothetical protein LDLANPLL_00423 [Turneriella sp.]|nr:hypothetical protein [Turneriella sp.]